MRSLTLILIFCLLGGIAFADNVDLSHYEALCDSFEAARVNADYETATSLVWPEAVVMTANGQGGGSLLRDIEGRAKNRQKAGKSGPFESVRVVERTIVPHGYAFIVTELLGATAEVETGMKVKPRRRMTTWTNRNDQWKVASVHSSDYSQWEKSILAFEETDKRARYASHSIVFIGSSSIRGWKTLSEDFPGLPVLRRGFGGSQLIDSVMYAHRIVTPYQPSAVAVYAGDNDVAKGKSSERVFHDFKLLVETVHAANPKTRIGFIAIKPSLSRWNMWPKMNKANQMVADFARQHPLITYLDIATPMLGSDGTPKPEYFVKDGLHMTPAGYDAWTQVVMPWAKQK